MTNCKHFSRFLGRTLAYKNELRIRLGSRASKEVFVRARFGGFCKPYRLDVLVDHGAIFELKAVNELTDAHRAQLLNYLLLTESRHGKLMTFRTPPIKHEFVWSNHRSPKSPLGERGHSPQGYGPSPRCRRLRRTCATFHQSYNFELRALHCRPAERSFVHDNFATLMTEKRRTEKSS